MSSGAAAAALVLLAQHAGEMAVHGSAEPWEMSAQEIAERRAQIAGMPERRPLSRKVFGYLPYWGGDWRSTRFDLLTSLSYFTLAIDADGEITNRHGWGGTTARELVDEAKRWGVKVSVSVALFGGSDIAALLSDPAKRTRTIQTLVAEVRQGGGEGISIDFEFVPRSVKNEFVLFMRELSAEMWGEIPGSEVSIAMPSVDSAGAYDFDQLAAACDLLFIMGYGYHWGGGGPGPLSPVRSGTIWNRYNLQWTIDDYVRWGGPNIKDKLILGMPWYGHDWPARTSTVPSPRGTGDSRSVFYRNMAPLIAQHGRRWEPESGTPFLVWEPTAGSYRQLFYDDGESWESKIDLVETQDVAGIGIWALTYERGTTDFWDLFEERLVIPEQPDGGVPIDAGLPEPDAGGLDGMADAAEDDATEPDAGFPPDAAPSPDAEPAADTAPVAPDAPDAGGATQPEPANGEGCACSDVRARGGSRVLPWLAAALAAAAVSARARRQTRRGRSRSPHPRRSG